MSLTPIETWSNICLSYNLITGYRVIRRILPCQPVNRLSFVTHDPSRPLPGLRQHALLARPGDAHGDAEHASRSRGLDQGGQSAFEQGARNRAGVARDALAALR